VFFVNNISNSFRLLIRKFRVTVITMLVAFSCIASTQNDETYLGTVPAPELPQGLDWLNVNNPLTLQDLRGKIVILDFWTYGCINCLHVIPELNDLEEKYSDELVVIGVHSGKFDHERKSKSIENVLERYQINHPVVNDKAFEIWRRYGIRAWPTLVLIDPNGFVIGIHEGEHIFELFDQVLSKAVNEFRELGLLEKFRIQMPRPKGITTPLRFPGKVLADHPRNRIFIADSNHNRIVVVTKDGTVTDVIGSGAEGLVDGTYEEARLFRPQGLTLVDSETLFVADTGNHSIRRVNLDARTVTTVIGTGQQGYPTPAGIGRGDTALNSPWDLEFLDGKVYIAMAGQHQLWVLDVITNALSLHAGSGKEELVDGPLLKAGLNQPSGLTTDGNQIYFVDSEASAIRRAGTSPSDSVDTIVGSGLFDFGDVDGIGEHVRLQHPIGVEFAGRNLYVADTYNNKIKVVDPVLQKANTVFGSGDSGWLDGYGETAEFNEPGGLSQSSGMLYVADTNNHVVRVIDLATSEVDTLVLKDENGKLQQSTLSTKETNKIFLPKKIVKTGESKLVFSVELPDGHRFTENAPTSITFSSDGVDFYQEPMPFGKPEFPIEVPVYISSTAQELQVGVVVYFCQDEKAKLCLIHDVELYLPIEISEKGSEIINLQYQVP